MSKKLYNSPRIENADRMYSHLASYHSHKSKEEQPLGGAEEYF